MRLTQEPSISLLGFYPRKMKADVHTGTCVRMFTEAFVHNHPKLETTPVDEQTGASIEWSAIQW